MDDSRRCRFVVKKKGRRCRMLVKEGKQFCGEHANASGTEVERIPCPLDPNHTVYSNQLEEHLVKCNSRLRLEDPWVVENINAGDVVEEPLTGQTKVVLKELPDKEFNAIIAKIEKCFDQNVAGKILDDFLLSKTLETQLNDPTFSEEQRKHFKQQSSILAHMEHLHLVKDNTCFVEFGAGRAKLSYWLNKHVTERQLTRCKFLLIERSGQRYKFENKALREEQDLDVQRIRCDITHVDLGLVPSLIENRQPLVGLCKHLCGAGTDVALRCLVNCRNGPNLLEVAGAALAPCCHHRCTWPTFVGKAAYLDLGFSLEEFPLLVQISSWATCGFKPTEKQQTDCSTIRLVDREQVGRKCKAIFDYCRAKYLESQGFCVDLCYFVPVEVTPENLLYLLH